MTKFPFTQKDLEKCTLWQMENHVRDWVGQRALVDLTEFMSPAEKPSTIDFEQFSDFFKLGDFGNEVLYDMLSSRGTWAARREIDLEEATKHALEQGIKAGKALIESKGQATVVYVGPPAFRPTFIEGIQSVMPPEMFSRYGGYNPETGEILTGPDMYK